MRKDAMDRRERIVAAAAYIFARDGYAVALDVIASEAGVGRATLYRNFTDRCDLALAVIERHLAAVAAVADRVSESPDGFLLMLRAMCEGRTDHGALAAAVAAQHGDHGRRAIALLRARMEGLCAVPVARAKRSGLLRDDFALADIHRLTLMLAAGAAERNEADREEEFDRTLGLLFDGLRPRSVSTATSTPITAVDEPSNKRSRVSGNEKAAC